jgi:hypothetical protein
VDAAVLAARLGEEDGVYRRLRTAEPMTVRQALTRTVCTVRHPVALGLLRQKRQQNLIEYHGLFPIRAVPGFAHHVNLGMRHMLRLHA